MTIKTCTFRGVYGGALCHAPAPVGLATKQKCAKYTLKLRQSCKSGRAFLIGFGPEVEKISGLIRAWDALFVLGAQKYNQNNLATLLNFTELTFVMVMLWAIFCNALEKLAIFILMPFGSQIFTYLENFICLVWLLEWLKILKDPLEEDFPIVASSHILFTVPNLIFFYMNLL